MGEELTDWLLSAACRGMDVNEFFPLNGDYSRVTPVCGRCAVRQECFDMAVKQELDLYGLFGGLTPKARHLQKGKLK